jgi:hypothetical protein
MKISISHECETMEEAMTWLQSLGVTPTADATTLDVETPAPKKGKKAKPEPVVEEDDAPAEVVADDEDEEDDDEDEEPEEEEEETPPAKGSTNVKLTPKLVGATKLREVITELMSQGVDTKAKLVKVCHALKGKIEVLKSIDIDARVPKMAELLKPSIT